MSKLLDRIERLLTGYTAQERADIQRRYLDQRADAAYQRLVDDLEAHLEEDIAAERIAANLLSLEDVPADVLLDDSPARAALVWLMHRGADVYAYYSGGPTYGAWVVWLGPLAEVRPGKDGRQSIAAWRISWRDLLDEMGLSAAAREAGVIA